MNDKSILRQLALAYLVCAKQERNAERHKLHKAVNDLHMIRPVILVDELPWNQMNISDELTLLCADPYLREVEWFLRSNLYKYRHFPADMILRPYIPVNKIITSTGIGVQVDENILSSESGNSIVSHDYRDQLGTDEDIDRLHAPVLGYNEAETLRRYNLVGELVGDIIPVRICGTDHFFCASWDDISMYRGVSNLLYDLADRPEFCHKTIKKLTEIKASELTQLETLGLFDPDPWSLHCTAIATDDLPAASREPLTRKDVWGRGTAQIFASVSKDMHEEFDIEYMKTTVGQCGLAYYGCCEPLDKKIDIVEKLPNLRKISITPWADINVAAEAVNTRYVIASKPNPAAVAVPVLDADVVKKEIKTILDACKRNNCSVDIVLKDISTCCNRPQNIFEWEKIVMGMVENY